MFTDLLFRDGEMSFGAFMILYLVILILSAIVYKLGFARKLPILKTIIVYIFLAIGAFPMAVLGIALPFVEALVIALIVLLIIRWRNPNFDPDERA